LPKPPDKPAEFAGLIRQLNYYNYYY